MTQVECPAHLIQKSRDAGDPVEQLSAPTASRATALAILTARIMMKFFQAQLSRISPDRLILKECHPRVLKKRFGSRQVVGYTLVFSTASNGVSRSIEVVAKRYADGVEGERAFRAMQSLWEAGFGEGSRLSIPKPLCYLPDSKLLIQEMAPGVLLPEYLGRSDSAALARFRMAARWLHKLHRFPASAAPVGSDEEDASSVTLFADQLAERYPHPAGRVAELAASIRRRLNCPNEMPLAITHGDFHPENIFVTGATATVIDFDRCVLSDPARDLACFVADVRDMGYRSSGSLDAANGQVGAFLNAYWAASRPEHRERLGRRICAYAAQRVLERMYYVLCVLGVDNPDVLSAGLEEIDQFLSAADIGEVITERTAEPLVSTGLTPPTEGRADHMTALGANAEPVSGAQQHQAHASRW